MKIKLPFRNYPRYKLTLYNADGSVNYRRGSTVKNVDIELPDGLLSAICCGLDEAGTVHSTHMLNEHWCALDEEKLAELIAPPKPKKKYTPKKPEVKKLEVKECPSLLSDEVHVELPKEETQDYLTKDES